MSEPAARPAPALIVLNAGSSSIKFAAFEASEALTQLLSGQIEGLGVAPRLVMSGTAAGASPIDCPSHEAATERILAELVRELDGRKIAGIGHRVVHGGTRFADPVRIDDDVLGALDALAALAPLHQPHNLAPIRILAARWPQTVQIACFDTAFHARQPAIATRFALPRALHDEGVRRYGFHGLSYESVCERITSDAPHLADKRLIIAHLGNGASLCAVHGGRSVASTMGFTAVDGLMMGTRTGALDPGVLLWLMDEKGMDAAAIQRLIYQQSGLLGVSGVSSDMRVLRASDDPAAREAIDLFIYRIIREAGSLAAALGGCDALVFTAGIGENDAATRAEVVAGCGWLGLELEPARNAAGTPRLSPDGAPCEVWMIPTDEERMIAAHVWRMITDDSINTKV
ncbi:MAG: acetate/propionate family kinase [Erythrobacter sp.]